MKTVNELIRERRLALGMSLTQLARKVDSAKSYLSMIENRQVANPPSDRFLLKLETALGITDGTLRKAADWARVPQAVQQEVHRISDDARRGKELAEFLKNASANNRGGKNNLDSLYRSGQLRRKIEQTLGKDNQNPGQSSIPIRSQPTQIPLVNKVPAGYPQGFTDLDYPARAADSYLGCPDLNDPDAFAAVVVGESMLPQYTEGDIVIFSPAADVLDGNDCFVRLEPDHETTFKRIFFSNNDNTIRLQPLNPKFPPAVYPRDQVAGLYRAMFRYSKI